MPGVRKYSNNSYRANCVVNGEKLQIYFESQKKAMSFCELIEKFNKTKRNPWCKSRMSKRKDAIDQGLPVGIGSSYEKKGDFTYRYLYVITPDGKKFTRAFGENRSKSDALASLIAAAIKHCDNQ